MLLSCPMGIVVKAPHGSVLEGSVHPLDLPVSPRMPGFGQAVLDLVLAADAVEHVQPVAGGGVPLVLRHVAELHAVVGQYGVDPVRDGFDQSLQEVTAVLTFAASCNWAKANLEVRSTATKRWSLPSSVITSAMSM